VPVRDEGDPADVELQVVLLGRLIQRQVVGDATSTMPDVDADEAGIGLAGEGLEEPRPRLLGYLDRGLGEVAGHDGESRRRGGGFGGTLQLIPAANDTESTPSVQRS
jgi:hypothetical protein